MAFVATTVLKKRFWDVYIKAANIGSWVSNGSAPYMNKIGQLDADASAKLSAADSQKLATGIEAQISENGEVNFTILGDGGTDMAIFAANFGALQSLINVSIDIWFIPAGVVTPLSTSNVKISGVYLYPAVDVTSNAINKIICTAKREAEAGSTVVSFNQTVPVA